MTTGAIRRAKLQSNHHQQQTNTQCFTGRMSFLSPNQQCQSTEGKKCSRLFDTYQRVMCVTCTGMSLLGRETDASDDDDDDDDDDNVLYQATLTNNNTPYASRSTNSGTDNTGTSTTSAGSTRTGNSGTSISNSSSTTITTTNSTNSGVGLSREIR